MSLNQQKPPLVRRARVLLVAIVFLGLVVLVAASSLPTVSCGDDKGPAAPRQSTWRDFVPGSFVVYRVQQEFMGGSLPPSEKTLRYTLVEVKPTLCVLRVAQIVDGSESAAPNLVNRIQDDDDAAPRPAQNRTHVGEEILSLGSIAKPCKIFRMVQQSGRVERVWIADDGVQLLGTWDDERSHEVLRVDQLGLDVKIGTSSFKCQRTTRASISSDQSLVRIETSSFELPNRFARVETWGTSTGGPAGARTVEETIDAKLERKSPR